MPLQWRVEQHVADERDRSEQRGKRPDRKREQPHRDCRENEAEPKRDLRVEPPARTAGAYDRAPADRQGARLFVLLQPVPSNCKLLPLAVAVFSTMLLGHTT